MTGRLPTLFSCDEPDPDKQHSKAAKALPALEVLPVSSVAHDGTDADCRLPPACACYADQMHDSTADVSELTKLELPHKAGQFRVVPQQQAPISATQQFLLQVEVCNLDGEYSVNCTQSPPSVSFRGKQLPGRGLEASAWKWQWSLLLYSCNRSARTRAMFSARGRSSSVSRRFKQTILFQPGPSSLPAEGLAGTRTGSSGQGGWWGSLAGGSQKTRCWCC